MHGFCSESEDVEGNRVKIGWLKTFFDCSFFDIFSDLKLSEEYFNWKTIIKNTSQERINETFLNQSNWFGTTTSLCEENDQDINITTCHEWHPLFFILTIGCVFMPSSYVLSTICGTKISGPVGFVWGLIGCILSMIFLTEYWFIFFGFSAILFLYSTFKLFGKHKTNWSINSNCIFFLTTFPLFVLTSPLLFLWIKFVSVIKKDYKLQIEKKYVSQSESMFEATPQLGLQLYILFLKREPSLVLLFSIATSALSMSIPNIEIYLSSFPEPYGLLSIVKYFLIFQTFSLFKVMSISLIVAMLNGLGFYYPIIVIVGYILVMLIICLIFKKYLLEDRLITEIMRIHSSNCILLSWLTITNLGPSKSATRMRLVSSYCCVAYYSMTFFIIILISNYKADVQISPILYEVSICTILFGVSALILDFLYLMCTRAVIHQALNNDC